MARLLVKAISAIHADPATDKLSMYKAGDIVIVRPDGHVWGGMEGLPTFYQIDLPNVTPEQIPYLQEAHQESPDESSSVALKKIKRLFMKVSKLAPRNDIRRRRYAFDLTTITFTNGQATLTDFNQLQDKKGT